MSSATTRPTPTREIIFLFEEAPEGGFTALGFAIFTEADDMGALKANIRDAVACHFEGEDRPGVVRLHGR
jgi:hypothetical protein